MGAVAAGLVLGVQACSVSTSTNADSGSGSSDGAGQIALPDSIKSKGAIDVGAYFNYPPYTLGQGNQLSGVEADLMRAVGKELGVNIRFHDLAFEAMIPSVVNGRSDVLIGPLADNPDRRAQVSFIDTLNTRMSLLVQKGNPKHVSASDICGLTGGEAGGSQQETTLKLVQADCQKAGKPALNLLSFGEVSQPFLSVKNGRTDFTLQDPAVATYTAQQDPTLEVLPGHIAEDKPIVEGWVVAKDNMDLAGAIVQAIQKLAADGTWQSIMEKAGLGDAMKVPPTINAQPASVATAK